MRVLGVSSKNSLESSDNYSQKRRRNKCAKSKVEPLRLVYGVDIIVPQVVEMAETVVVGRERERYFNLKTLEELMGKGELVQTPKLFSTFLSTRSWMVCLYI